MQKEYGVIPEVKPRSDGTNDIFISAFSGLKNQISFQV